MEAQNIEYATSENVNYDSNLLSNLWPKVEYESASYHSIKPGFEGPVAKKFLNGIYYIYCFSRIRHIYTAISQHRRKSCAKEILCG